MNKQDLKEGQEVYVKGQVIHTGDHLDIVLAKGSFIENAIILHHEKPVVPQYVADWYEKYKDDLEYSIWDYMYSWDSQEDSEFKNWFDCAKNNALHTIINMHQFGYKVEKEKRYLVKMKGVNEECEYLVFGELSNTWKLRSLGSFGELRKHHTRKELEEAGFGEVFNSPLFEVEEVE